MVAGAVLLNEAGHHFGGDEEVEDPELLLALAMSRQTSGSGMEAAGMQEDGDEDAELQMALAMSRDCAGPSAEEVAASMSFWGYEDHAASPSQVPHTQPDPAQQQPSAEQQEQSGRAALLQPKPRKKLPSVEELMKQREALLQQAETRPSMPECSTCSNMTGFVCSQLQEQGIVATEPPDGGDVLQEKRTLRGNTKATKKAMKQSHREMLAVAVEHYQRLLAGGRAAEGCAQGSRKRGGRTRWLLSLQVHAPLTILPSGTGTGSRIKCPSLPPECSSL